jgi:single-stranded-DNA-specific exonuclease
VKPVDSTTADTISKELGIAPIVAKLLVQRGYDTPEQASAFMGGDASSHWHDPFLLAGMERAVDRLKMAIATGECIRVYGDYDADGVSSTAFAARLLQMMGAQFDTYIPHRQREGYGLNVAAVEQAAADGVRVLLTVDNGVSAVEPIARARELGIDVVVTDHHEPPAMLPDAYVIVNPKLASCTYPFKGLAGVGVIAKVAEAMLGIRSGESGLPDALAQLIPVGTVADVMPLVDENRRFVKQGLVALKRSPLPGLKALLREASVDYAQATAMHFGFAVGPRINASGRLDSAQPSLELLLADEDGAAVLWAQQLSELNLKRQRLVEEVNQAALAQVSERYGDALPGCIVVAAADWNPGVVGIAAAKLVELTGRPTFVLGIDAATGIAKGSGRSSGAFDLHKALTACADLLDHYGGHHAAAGLSLQANQLPELISRLAAIADSELTADDFLPTMVADLTCGLEDITIELITQINQLAPFGAGNPAPRFLIPGAQIATTRTLGKSNQHLKLSLKSKTAAQPFDAIAFNKGRLSEQLGKEAIIELICELDINEWNGQRKPQLLIQDIQTTARHGIDWRGLKKTDKRLEDWLSLHANEPTTAIVDFEQVPGPQVPGPLEPGTFTGGYPQITHVLFAGRPKSLAQLRQTIAQYPNTQTWVGWFGDTQVESSLAILPTRDRFKRLYAELKQQTRLAINQEALQTFAKRIGESPATLTFMLDVFEQLQFITRNGLAYEYNNSPPKTTLESSSIYVERYNFAELEELLTYESGAGFIAWMEAVFSSAFYTSDRK